MPCFHHAISIKLHLHHSRMGYPLVLSDELPMLERLFIAGCCFSLDHLILRCALLHVLEVRDSHLGDTVKVNSTTIEELTLHGVCAIDINAPALQRLTIVGLLTTDLIFLCPCLRVLKVCHPPRDEIFKVYSTTIEELVVDTYTYTYSYMKGIDITAPSLKKFTLNACMTENFSMSLSTPVVENLWWDCLFGVKDVGLCGMWSLELLNLWIQKSVYILNLHIYPIPSLTSLPFLQNFQEVVPLPHISVLELHLHSGSHVYGSIVLNLLGIFTAIQRLKLTIHRETHAKECPSNCTCDQPQDWRSQIISLPALEVVEVENFQGSIHEVDFLKLLFKCKTLMRRVTVKLSPYILHRGCKNMYNIFKADHSVKCFVYDSSGKKVMYE